MASSILCLLPIAYFLLSSFISCLALNASQQYRLYFLLPILLPALKSFTCITHLDRVSPAASILMGHTVLIHIVHITSVLYIEKWQLHSKREGKGWDLHAAYKIWSNPQLLNTSREVPFARKYAENENERPSRWGFCCSRGFQLAVLWTMDRYIVSAIIMEALNPRSQTGSLLLLHYPATLSLYRVFLRAALSLHWIWLNILGLHSAHSLLAVLFSIILRWDEPVEWPPLFGSPFEAYTLRRFWARFWHRIVVRPYTSWGMRMAHFFRLETGSTGDKMFVAVFVFALSGVMHGLVSQVTLGCGWEGDVKWFLMNAGVAVGETVVIKAWERIVGKTHRGRGSVLWRVVGWLWVLGFFYRTVPGWEMGKVYCVLDKMGLDIDIEVLQ